MWLRKDIHETLANGGILRYILDQTQKRQFPNGILAGEFKIQPELKLGAFHSPALLRVSLSLEEITYNLNLEFYNKQQVKKDVEAAEKEAKGHADYALEKYKEIAKESRLSLEQVFSRYRRPEDIITQEMQPIVSKRDLIFNVGYIQVAHIQRKFPRDQPR